MLLDWPSDMAADRLNGRTGTVFGFGQCKFSNKQTTTLHLRCVRIDAVTWAITAVTTSES